MSWDLEHESWICRRRTPPADLPKVDRPRGSPKAPAGPPSLTAARRPQQHGFQLLDLMLTCLLVAFLAVSGLPFLRDLSLQQKQVAACDLFVSTLSQARSLAIFRNLPVEVLVEPPGRFASSARFEGEPIVWRLLPEPVVFQQFPRRSVTFHPRGTAAPGGTFVLSTGRGGFKIVVAVSGRIRWSRLR